MKDFNPLPFSLHSSPFTLKIFLFFVIAAVFLVGVVKLFALRFQTGDIYPPYSSLRSDPLGTEAFYESLEYLDGVSVSRSFSQINSSNIQDDITVFVMGVRVGIKSEITKESSLITFERMAAQGARLVISFYPFNERSTDIDAEEKPSSINVSPFFKLTTRWGVGLSYDENQRGINAKIHTSVNEIEKKIITDLPDSISWHSALYFDLLKSVWKAVYTRNEKPVIIERIFGKGSIVLCSDAYLFSNEALRNDRNTNLLLWFIGKNQRIIFDEHHLGIQKNPGIASIARKYRLQGVFWVIIAIAVLFIWKISSPFVHPRNDESIAGMDTPPERDAFEGLISLLRRNIPPKDILSVCVTEWEKSAGSKIPQKQDYKGLSRIVENYIELYRITKSG